MPIRGIIWDLPDDPGGNVAHIEEHGLTIEEVEEVLLDPSNPVDRSRTSGRFVTFGYTSADQHIAVVWEVVDESPLMVRPITAYEVNASR